MLLDLIREKRREEARKEKVDKIATSGFVREGFLKNPIKSLGVGRFGKRPNFLRDFFGTLP